MLRLVVLSHGCRCPVGSGIPVAADWMEVPSGAVSVDGVQRTERKGYNNGPEGNGRFHGGIVPQTPFETQADSYDGTL